MKITPHEIPVRDLVANYVDDEDRGVIGYGGRLNIRPAYQREFVYKDKQRDAVIESVMKGMPLNVMYWSLCPDGTYECMDGQQRTISLCQYAVNNFSIKLDGDSPVNIYNLKITRSDLYDKFMNYKLLVYICEGTESEKLEWFEIINIAGVALMKQEMRNAIYHGTWVTDAKKYFSKTGGPAYQIGGDYMSGSAIRQEYFESVLRWVCDRDDIASIEEYMLKHQGDMSAMDLWEYFESVIKWVKTIFINHDKARLSLMKGQPWGILYNKYKDDQFDPDALENKIQKLILDDDVTNKKGIYEYLFDYDSKRLNIRIFSDKDKHRKYEEQQGICPHCGNHFEYDEMQGDHIIAWSNGGHTEYDNLQMLCRKCNNLKSDK